MCVCVCVYVCMYEYMCVCVCVCRPVTVSTHIMEGTGFCEAVAFTPLTAKSSGYHLRLQFHFKLDKSAGSLHGIGTLSL